MRTMLFVGEVGTYSQLLRSLVSHTARKQGSVNPKCRNNPIISELKSNQVWDRVDILPIREE